MHHPLPLARQTWPAVTLLALWPATAWASDMCVLTLFYLLPPMWGCALLAALTSLAAGTRLAKVGVGVLAACTLAMLPLAGWSVVASTCPGDGRQILLWTLPSVLAYCAAAGLALRRLLTPGA